MADNDANADADRSALATALSARFPEAAARDPRISPIRGGRRAALDALSKIRPAQYGRTRNFLNGAVTRLSPYLTHGVLSLAEVRDAVLGTVKNPDNADKLMSELGWRDYYQRIYGLIGSGIWKNLEPTKTGLTGSAYADDLPADLVQGQTGLACIDAFTNELYETGYLHNHARMWMAAYVVHHRRVQWQAGARWFLLHLLDGNPASNNLSWQWVASTFSHKPYFFNRENLERYTEAAYCPTCPLLGHCDFEGSYAALEQRLFSRVVETDDEVPSPSTHSRSLMAPADTEYAQQSAGPTEDPSTVIWIHPEDLNPSGASISAFPGSRAIFVWDTEWLAKPAVGLKRIMFIEECLAEFPAELVIREGHSAEVVAEFARQHGATRVASGFSPNPVLVSVRDRLSSDHKLRVETIVDKPFVEITRPIDLTRFSRYWRLAERRL